MASFPSLLESIDDLSLEQIDVLVSRSLHFKKNPQLSPFDSTPKPIVATSFLENSTRTKHSFAVAIGRLGGQYLDFNAETSSLKKGESLEETFLTLFHQYIYYMTQLLYFFSNCFVINQTFYYATNFINV